MYKAVRKTKSVRRYIEALSLHTGAPTLHWEYNTSCIYVVEAKIVNLRVKHIGIPLCFLQEKFYNGIFDLKYEKSSVVTADKCTKPCSGPIISRSNECMTGFILYPTSYTEQYQLMILHYFVIN